MSLRCLISTSSFGKQAYESIAQLEAVGFEIRLNPFGRKLRKKETLEFYSEADVVIAGVEEIDREVFANCPNLRAISRCGIGVDNIDLLEAQRRGIPILTTPEPPAKAVSELAVGMMFALARGICIANAAMQRGEWNPIMGAQMSGKTLGIIGFGRVGRKVAGIMRAVGMDVCAYDPALDAEGASALGATLEGLDGMLARADFVSVHVPLLPETRGLLGGNKLGRMKRGSFLINTSRGGIVDELALFKSLKCGHLAGAALDVFEEEPYQGPLAGLPNVVLTPHMGSYAAESRRDMEIEAVRNLIAECQRRNWI